MSILEHLNKDNLHHAYLIEGVGDEIVPEIIKFLKSIKIDTIGSSDFVSINLDSFKIEDARNLKSYVSQKSFSQSPRIFVVSVNNFLLEAQNSLLKMFEEPIANTHFFLIVPDTNTLLKTFVSRFYVISARQDLAKYTKDAEKFISMPLKNRIDFIKELLTEEDTEDGEGNEIIVLNSSRAKALKFLNALEVSLHNKMSKDTFDINFFQHFFKVREFLRMPGSSTKTLMELVALVTPIF